MLPRVTEGQAVGTLLHLIFLIYRSALDIIVMGTITGAPLLPFWALVTEAGNVGQGHKPSSDIGRSCPDEQLVFEFSECITHMYCNIDVTISS